jgi:hypothetical protein
LKHFAKLLMKINNVVISEPGVSDHPAGAVGMGRPTPAQMPPDTFFSFFT